MQRRSFIGSVIAAGLSLLGVRQSRKIFCLTSSFEHGWVRFKRADMKDLRPGMIVKFDSMESEPYIVDSHPAKNNEGVLYVKVKLMREIWRVST